ncbi:hypothetical protein [Halorientalis salina]|uniref:hypothetical protein n=1 Tax=Halorientalis salina TaxID=2932266 RepID=UPI0010AC6CC0|nr:hypothetical protein [Halorientalis salina]
MTDDSTNSTDGVPLDDLPLENTRRTLLRALGGTAVVGAMSGIAAGGDDDDHDDGQPVAHERLSFWIFDLLELHGLSTHDDAITLEELKLEGPVGNDTDAELLCVTDLEAVVEDDHLTELNHGSLEFHGTVESDVESMIRGDDERVDDVRDLMVSILNSNEDEIHDAVEPALEDGQAALLDLAPSLGDQFESAFDDILDELEAELDEAGGVEELSEQCIAEIDERGVLALVETEFGFTCLLLFLFSLLTVLSELETDSLDLPV